MHEMIQERRGAKAQGVERADLFTNLLNASEMEKGDGGGLSDTELTGTGHILCFFVTAYSLTAPPVAGNIVSFLLTIGNFEIIGF
jgi:hypothetical protein